MSDKERIAAAMETLQRAVRYNRAGAGDRQSILTALSQLGDSSIVTVKLKTS